MIDQLYPYLILIGMTIGAVMAALWYKARNASRLNLALIRLNEQNAFDMLAFLGQAWSLLAQSGLRGLEWQLAWFGVQSHGQEGRLKGRVQKREVEVGEMRLAITFYQHDGRGEQRYFEETLIATFMLLVRMDMLIKAGATDAALSHVARLNLFVQHDMKNIAQFIQLMADQLVSVPPGKEQRVLDYLRLATPLIRHRADRVVRSLTVGLAPAESAAPVPVRALLAQLCALYQLACKIDGDAIVHAAPSALETVFDNIIKNYHDLALRDQIDAMALHIVIVAGDPATITLCAPAAPSGAALERLFEPFWSSAQGGLGIGLYQARHVMESQGGTLHASQPAGEPLRFHITCPAALEAVIES